MRKSKIYHKVNFLPHRTSSRKQSKRMSKIRHDIQYSLVPQSLKLITFLPNKNFKKNDDDRK